MLLNTSLLRTENCSAGDPVEDPRQRSGILREGFTVATLIPEKLETPQPPVTLESDLPALPVISTSVIHLKEAVGRGPDREFWVTARLGTDHAPGERLHIVLEVQEDGRTVNGREVRYTDHFKRMGYRIR